LRIILLGPTAVGKTKLSILLARYYGIPILSADSRQCYKYMNIGTATPTFQTLCRARHHNISCLDLDEPDSATRFLERSKRWLNRGAESDQDGDTKDHIVCGGSTLHLRVLIEPFDELPSANPSNIEHLEEEIRQKGLDALYQRLAEVDPAYAQKMDGMNRQRIIRALDVWMQTGNPFSSFHSSGRTQITPDEQTIVVGLRRERSQLYDRINRRTLSMVEKGLIREVANIKQLCYSPTIQSLNTVGYREVFDYLEGELSRDEMIRQIQTKTRRYAKRQLTWFRKWKFIHWIDADQCTTQQAAENIIKLVEAHTNNA